jgi:hypothetical protein
MNQLMIIIIYFDDIDDHEELFEKYDEDEMRVILSKHMDEDKIEECISVHY